MSPVVTVILNMLVYVCTCITYNPFKYTVRELSLYSSSYICACTCTCNAGACSIAVFAVFLCLCTCLHVYTSSNMLRGI